MAVTVSSLDLEMFERLPKHSRQCVFWEVEPATPAPIEGFRSEFDKEAWISGLLLEWGTCGQLATESTTGHVVGAAFYAPPGRVPRSHHFPTSPVSADAVLLTAIRTEPGFEDSALGLLDSVITDLIRRGVRAIEAFGIVRSADDSALSDSGFTAGQAGTVQGRQTPVRRPPSVTSIPSDIAEWTEETIAEVAREILDAPVLRDDPIVLRNDPVLPGVGEYCAECIIDADLLKDNGFDVVASDPKFPRLRLELDEGLSWKAEVESALEKLVMKAAVDLSMRQGAEVGAGVAGFRCCG